MELLAPKNPEVSGTRRFLVVLILAVVSGLAITCLTIANTILPQIQGDLSVSLEQVSWIVTATAVTTAISMISAGWISKSLGQPNGLFICAVGMTASSFMLGLSSSLAEVVFWRAIQGLFAGAILPMSIETVVNIYSQKQLGRAISFYSLVYALPPSLVPWAAAYLTDWYTWKLAFFVLVPFGLAISIAIKLMVPRISSVPGVKLDWFGLGAICLALAAAQWTLDRGNREDWFDSAEIYISCGLSALAFYLFLAHSLTKKGTFVDLNVFRNRNFTLCVIIWGIAGIIEFVPLIMMPLYYSNIQDAPLSFVGLLLIPRCVGFTVGYLFHVSFLKHLSYKIVVLVGVTLHLPALWYMGMFDLTVGIQQFLLIGLCLGAAEFILATGLQPLAFSTLRSDLRSYGSAVLNAVRFFMISVGLSVSITMLATQSSINRSILSEYVYVSRELFRFGYSNALKHPMIIEVHQEILKQSFMIAYVSTFYLLLLLGLLLVPLVFLVKMKSSSSNKA